MFVERLIFKHVKERLAWYVEDPARYEQFLLDGGLNEDEALEARKAFVEHPPTTVHAYARQGGPFPCLALVLGAENTAADYLGESMGMMDIDGDVYVDQHTGEPVDCHLRRWEHRFDWYIYAGHPDLTLYYYYLLRHIMVGLRSRLQAEDLDEITYSGAELAPDPRYMPSDVFTRRFSITCRADEPYVEDFKPDVGLGSSITGLAVNDDGSIPTELTEEEQAELAAANFGVTTYTEE